MRRLCAAAEVLSKEFGDKPENIGGRRGLQEGPADSLQMNSNLLQRNSNITAIEFQQFQWGRRKSLLQRVKSQSNAASGRPQRKPNRSQFLGAAASHPAAVAPAHGF